MKKYINKILIILTVFFSFIIISNSKVFADYDFGEIY